MRTSPQGSGRAASTGRGTAALRAIESRGGENALIADPLAALLAGREGFSWVQSLSAGQQALLLDLIAVRTRFIDEVCTTFAESAEAGREPQIVLLGAGYDTRAYRLQALRNSAVFEVDYGPVLNVKSARLSEAGRDPLCRVHGLVSLDLNEATLSDPLTAAGFGPGGRTLWILEGLTGYLPEGTCRRLFAQMRQLSGPGSKTLSTFVGATGRAYGSNAPVSQRHAFYTDAGDALLDQCGWKAEQTAIGDIAATFNRAARLGSYDYWIAQASV
jgi:methyltransferase (TIGR00027 family)